MKLIRIGGLEVSRIGLGTMAMSGYYLDPNSSETESIRTIHRALDLGVTHLDTAEIYGPFRNEELVGRAIKDRRDQVGQYALEYRLEVRDPATLVGPLRRADVQSRATPRR
jgi:aryl-alcohol dehydrogenase-like predicted oxidoreductase